MKSMTECDTNNALIRSFTSPLGTGAGAAAVLGGRGGAEVAVNT